MKNYLRKKKIINLKILDTPKQKIIKESKNPGAF